MNTLQRKVAVALAAIVIVLIVGIEVAYRWANTVPSRPRGVSGDAVFLWAPYVGLPAPRRGSWLVCWEEAGHNRCKLNGVDGSTEYEGEFLPYGRKASIPAGKLRIDPTKTREHKVWVGDALVPLVWLENGDVLIPVSKYEEGTRIVDQLRPNRQ